jgi:O-antigen biosynthesis protein
MPSSRAVLVLGMHRSGTSALARGLQMLGVYLGSDFLSPQPDNPTGYWEDRNIYELNERLLAVFGLKWEDVALIDDARWDTPEVKTLRAEAVEYLRSQFVSHLGIQGSAHHSAAAFLALSALPSRS